MEVRSNNLENNEALLKKHLKEDQDQIYNFQLPSLESAMVNCIKRISWQKSELIKIEQNICHIKLLQEKAKIIKNEKTLEHKEIQDSIEKHHDDYKKITDFYLKLNLPAEINNEVSERSRKLKEEIDTVSEYLLLKKKKINDYKVELAKINSDILIQKMRKDDVLAQLQKTLQDARQDQMKAEKMLNKLRIKT